MVELSTLIGAVGVEIVEWCTGVESPPMRHRGVVEAMLSPVKASISPSGVREPLVWTGSSLPLVRYEGSIPLSSFGSDSISTPKTTTQHTRAERYSSSDDKFIMPELA